MKLHQMIALGAALLLLPTGCGDKKVVAPTEAPSSGKLKWLTNFETAKALALTQNKTLLINFTGSDWCPPCMMLEKEVFKQPEFAAYAAKHLVLLEVDFPHVKMQSLEEKATNEKLAEQFGIEGFPTVVLLDASGQPLGALGYEPGGPMPFLNTIEKAREADATSTP